MPTTNRFFTPFGNNARYGISCPPVSAYLDVMVDYFVEHSADPRIRKGDWRQTTS